MPAMHHCSAAVGAHTSAAAAAISLMPSAAPVTSAATSAVPCAAPVTSARGKLSPCDPGSPGPAAEADALFSKEEAGLKGP